MDVWNIARWHLHRLWLGVADKTELLKAIIFYLAKTKLSPFPEKGEEEGDLMIGFVKPGRFLINGENSIHGCIGLYYF